jgi:hypothetical protein
VQKTKNYYFPATEKHSQLGDIYFQVIASSYNNFLAGVVKTVKGISEEKKHEVKIFRDIVLLITRD